MVCSLQAQAQDGGAVDLVEQRRLRVEVVVGETASFSIVLDDLQQCCRRRRGRRRSDRSPMVATLSASSMARVRARRAAAAAPRACRPRTSVGQVERRRRPAGRPRPSRSPAFSALEDRLGVQQSGVEVVERPRRLSARDSAPPCPPAAAAPAAAGTGTARTSCRNCSTASILVRRRRRPGSLAARARATGRRASTTSAGRRDRAHETTFHRTPPATPAAYAGRSRSLVR